MHDPITFVHQLRVWDREATLHPPILVLKPEVVEVHSGARIDSYVKIEGGHGVYIGSGVHIGSMAHVNIGGGKVILEFGSVVCAGAKIVAGTNHPGGLSMSVAAPPELQYIERSFVVVKRLAFVATGAIVLPGVTLGEGAILAAGSVAHKDIPPWEVWAGIPAQKIRDRDFDLIREKTGVNPEWWFEDHPPQEDSPGASDPFWDLKSQAAWE